MMHPALKWLVVSRVQFQVSLNAPLNPKKTLLSYLQLRVPSYFHCKGTQLSWVICVEGTVHKVVNNPKREDVRRVRNYYLGLARTQYLRSNIARSTATFEQQVFLTHPTSQAEVCEDIVLCPVLVKTDHNVLEFDIAMQDTFLPHMLKPKG